MAVAAAAAIDVSSPTSSGEEAAIAVEDKADAADAAIAMRKLSLSAASDAAAAAAAAVGLADNDFVPYFQRVSISGDDNTGVG